MLCGMAQNLEEMVIFRAVQGVAGAFIAPLSQAAMLDTTKPSKQSAILALWGMGVMIGPILGPILGGWITENWNVALGVLRQRAGRRAVPGDHDGRAAVARDRQAPASTCSASR